MNLDADDIMAAVAIMALALVAGFLCWAFFWIMPISLNAESKCLAKGYPQTYVDWKGNAYCANLAGTVTVKVEALP